jgi:phosphoserine phosphatase
MGIALSILVYRMHTKHVLLEESEKYWLKIVKKRPIYNFIKRLEQGGCNVIFISAALEPAVNGLTSSISSHLISSQVLYNANGYAAGLGVDLLNRKVETLNERFPGVFKGRVLGISDNVQDLPMLRQCTIGIYLDRNISKAIRESRLIRIPYQENCYD